MTRAYDRVYLERARGVLGVMLEYLVHDLDYELSGAFEQFMKCGYAKRFGRGDFQLIAGKSGVELARLVVELCDGERCYKSPTCRMKRSREYWTGWALAYYQWYTSLTFSDIVESIPIEQIQELYDPYHEMDIRHFVEKMNELYRQRNPETNLKRMRLRARLTQKQLSELSGIPIRTIQQYEQRQKNINKAQVDYLISLSNVLCCDVEVLLEKVI